MLELHPLTIIRQSNSKLNIKIAEAFIGRFWVQKYCSYWKKMQNDQCEKVVESKVAAKEWL